MDVWSKNPQISSSANGKSRPHYIPLWGSYPSHPPAYPQGLSPLSLLPRNLGPLDKTLTGIAGRSSDRPILRKSSTLTLGRKVMTNLDSILKSRDITLPTKVHLVKAMVFPVVMYGCESWTIKKAEYRRIDALELWCWRRLLRVPWTARRSNQSILKEISPACSLEGLMVKLRLPILWPPHAKSWLIGKDPDAGKDCGQKKGTTEDEMAGWHHQLNGHEFE